MNKIKLQNRVSTDLSIESESEYFFDDQFSIPFDANLKEENNNISNDISLDINKNDYVKNQMCQSYSESCIYSDLDSSYQAFPDILDDLLDRKSSNKEILFTPPQSSSEMEIKDSMIRSSFSQSSLLLKELLTKQLSRDYRITFEEKSNLNSNRKTFSMINCSNSMNDNDNSNCNKVTWNQISNKNHNSLLKVKAKAETNNAEGNSTTWRQLKDNASNKVISWNKLKSPSKNGEDNLLHNASEVNSRSRSMMKNNNSITDSASKMNTSDVKYRAHSEPRKSHRFSGTLLEIYSRTRGLNQSKNSQEFLDLLENKIITEEAERNKTLINFGAQFPPTNPLDFQTRQRSNSLLEKKAQKYPGLGLIKTPKSTRLTHSAFLSRTLPDLSFLIKDNTNVSGDQKRLKSSSNNTKDSGFDSCTSNTEKLKDSNQFCSKCLSIFYDPPVTDDLIKLDDNKNESRKFDHHRSVPNFQLMDLLTGSPICNDKNYGGGNNNHDQLQENEAPLKSCLRQSLDRSVSEPDFGNSSKSASTKYCEYTESVDSSVSDLDNNRTNKAKKSVSFSEKIIKKPLSPIKYYGSCLSLWKNHLESSLTPQEIPRDWGLYGNASVMISEFALGSQLKCGKENELSNEDMKYKVMIRDIIKAVQETIANCSEQSMQNKNSSEVKSIKPPMYIVEPFFVLLTDGILPYQKNIMSIKSRYRLWNVIESSCNNVEYMNEIMKAVKKVPITNEKNRFKFFISNLIAGKLLQRWFRDLVDNDILLKTNYSKESFLRQVNTSLKGLYADLDTNLQLLDSLPYGNLMKTKSSQTKEKNLKPTTSVKSLKKSNMNQSSTSMSTKFQDLNKFKLSSQIEPDTKSSRTAIPTKSKISNTSSTSSITSSAPSLKKPVIYYPKYTVGKGKI